MVKSFTAVLNFEEELQIIHSLRHKPYLRGPGDLWFRALILRRPRADGHCPRADRCIFSLSKRTGTSYHTRRSKTEGHGATAEMLTVIDF